MSDQLDRREPPVPERTPAPPAPAPTPAPEPATRQSPAASTDAPESAPGPEPSVMVSEHAPRFRLVLGALIGIAIGSVAATIVLAAGRGPASDAKWSTWKPTSSSVSTGAQQIADHVAPTYRLADGDQLVGVTGGPLKLGQLDVPVRVKVAETGGGNVGIVGGRSVLYQLCGMGERCSIARGTPSEQRFLLLRREALELALYSFRYLDGVDSVVALMPPPKGQKPQNAVFFRRELLKGALERPLSHTLPSPPPSINSLVEHSSQAELVSQVTSPGIFCYSFQQAQDLGAFLVLQRPTNDSKKPCPESPGP